MTPDRLQRAFELFDAATALPEGERERFLAHECGADRELCDDVRSLLSAHCEAERFLSSRVGRTGSAEDGPALPALAPGTRLGSFAIESFVGAGGMGEVYKARDTRLDRHVAIKVLRSDTAADPRSRARFTFEARAIARLTHPRICALHDIAHSDGVDFLVMEFLEGETLADRLRRESLSLGEALHIALEIGEALSAAHARGIVHRDLKPGNVMLTPTGARLLDFGLARLKARGVPTEEAATATVSGAVESASGLIVGTLRYMAPEQLEGKDVDARADIFAFGIVLYEMIAGRRPFEGTTTVSLMTAILSSEPPPMAVKPVAPVSLERLIRTCLAKNPDERWASIHDVLMQLEWIASDTTAGPAPAVEKSANPHQVRVLWSAAAAVLLVAVAAGALWWNLRRPAVEARMLVLSVSPPQGVVLAAESPPAISADGRRLGFIAMDAAGRQLLYQQAIDSHADAQPIANTDGALFPFWAPDGSRLGFFADGQLKIVELDSGRIQSLAPAAQPRGGTWNNDDVIVFVPRPLDGFYRISARGGDALPLKLSVPPGAPGWYPSFLPDGRHLLVYVPSPQDPDKARVAVISLDADTRTDLISSTRSNALFATGHVLFWRDGTLMAQPFDAAARRLHENPLALPSSAGLNRLTNQALFSVSSSGTLVLFGDAAGQTQLEWVDRSGTRIGTAGPTGLFNSLSLAPDDTQVVYDESAARSGTVDLHRFDFATGQTVRLTFNAAHDMFPFWSRDGRWILFNSLRAIPPKLFAIDAESTGNERQILEKPFPTIPNDVSSDGKFLIYQGIRPVTNGDVFAVALDGSQQDMPLLDTRANEGHAMLSPDGRLLAYISNEGGRYEVFVRQFPVADGGRQWQISADGGFEPSWRRDGKELFFLAPNRTLMSVEVTGTASTFDHGSPRALFPTHVTWLENQAMGRHYAPSRDGQRFLIANATDRARTMPITVVLNWAAGLGR